MRAAFILFLASCAPNEADTGDGSSAPITVEIVAPDHGAKYDRGDNIHFEVEVKEGKADAKTDSVVWTIGDQEIRGTEGDLSKLASGDYDVKVVVKIGEDSYTDEVGITVRESGDADADSDSDSDADADSDTDVPYAGSLTSHVALHGDYDYEDDCNGSVSLTYTAVNTITGTGTCRLGDYDMNYTIEGTADKGDLAGDMIMVNDGTEYRTPWTGNGHSGDPINANFDKTFRDSGNTLQIQGTWSANPL